MTTTVKKGTCRPTAKARQAKAAQRTPLPPRQMGSLAEEAAKAPNPGVGKAAALTAFLATLGGWKVRVRSLPGDRVELIASRRRELMNVVWVAGCYLYSDSFYTIGDRSRKVLNVSAFRRIASEVES